MKRMSCFVTQGAVRSRTKTVTRRRVESWADAKPGHRVLLIEKGQGLKKGEKQVILAAVEIVGVRVESARKPYGDDEAAREGFPDLTWEEFQTGVLYPLTGEGELRRIEWVYLADELSSLQMRLGF